MEIPWALRNAVAPVLDVGCAESPYLQDLPSPVDGIDVRPGRSSGLRHEFLGDIRDTKFQEKYSTVLAISTLEHVGMEHGPYGTHDDEVEGGDQTALIACYDAVNRGGRLLISVPFGAPRDYGWFRQYDLAGLEKLCGPLFFTAEIWVGEDGSEWRELDNLDDVEYVEQLEYNFDAGSARAVALIVIEKPSET